MRTALLTPSSPHLPPLAPPLNCYLSHSPSNCPCRLPTQKKKHAAAQFRRRRPPFRPAELSRRDGLPRDGSRSRDSQLNLRPPRIRFFCRRLAPILHGLPQTDVSEMVGASVLLPTCFASVTHLDLSYLSPWGHPFLLHHQRHHHQHEHPTTEEEQQHHLIALLLRRAFHNLTSLTVYAQHPSTLQALTPQWPGLRHAKLVRWHQRPRPHPHGADLAPLLTACPLLDSLDLSQFYCWAEDVTAALHAFLAAAASLARLDLLSPVVEGFQATELVSISAACPNLRHLLTPSTSNPL